MPEVALTPRSPLRNLAAEDLQMAMLDLVQFSHALSRLPGQSPSTEDKSALTLICTEGGQRLVGICEGPDWVGRCPSVAEGHLPCTGSWLMTSGGWTFKVADDAIVCPLAVLGLASPPAWSQYAASA